MSEAQGLLPHSPRSARRARELLRVKVSAWNIDGVAIYTTELPLSELFSNAIRHARRPAGREIGVRIARHDARLPVEVADANSARPEPRKITAEDERGRGLLLVRVLADR